MLTHSNVLEIYEQVQKFEITKLDQKIVDTIQSNTYDLIKDESFLNIHRSTLEFILLQPKLSILEHDLFDACIRWARSECVRNKIINPSPNELRKALGSALYLIRIFSFTLKTFISSSCKSELFTKEEALEILLHLESNKSLTNNFVSKFNSIPRIFCGSKWTEFVTHNRRTPCRSWMECNFQSSFVFDKMVYLKGFAVQNPDCDYSAFYTTIKKLIIRNEVSVLFCKNEINFKSHNYEIIFDVPIVLKPKSTIHVELLTECRCLTDSKLIQNRLDVQTNRNDQLIACEYSLEWMPSCFKSVSLFLY